MCMETDNYCPQTYNYIFAILKVMILKLGDFINFKVLFPAVAIEFSLAARYQKLKLM